MRAINAMRANLGELLTVDDMARAAMFSKFHFTRIFQRTTGLSPRRFLSALRLERAKRLLVSTSLNVTDISLRVGYNSVGTFSSRFSRSVGLSPTMYRRLAHRQLAGYAPQIPTDPADNTCPPSQARIQGLIRPARTGRTGLVFVGLFPERIPEGRPARCTILVEPGPFDFEQVPAGTWHVLAQSVSDDYMPTADADGLDQSVSVAAHGPVMIDADTVTRIELDLQPVRALDPPFLMALLDVRRLALAEGEDEDQGQDEGEARWSTPPRTIGRAVVPRPGTAA
jgi:AraC-like DNA-binding protein